MATKKIGLGFWVFLCLAAPAVLHAAQEEAEEKYSEERPPLAKQQEAEEAYHVRNPLVLLMGASDYAAARAEGLRWQDVTGVGNDLTILYDLFHNVYHYTVYSTFNEADSKSLVLTKERLKSFLQEHTSKIVYPPYDSLILFFSGHGSKGDVLVMSDGTPIPQQDIQTNFAQTAICPQEEVCQPLQQGFIHFINKPKLFFVAACRGKGVIHLVNPDQKRSYPLDGAAQAAPLRYNLFQNWMLVHGTVQGAGISDGGYKGMSYLTGNLNRFLRTHREHPQPISTILDKIGEFVDQECSLECVEYTNRIRKPLYLRSGYDILPLYNACKAGNLEQTQQLLQAPYALPNLPNQQEKGKTPFYIACKQGHLEVVKLLVNHKRIKPNTPDNFGVTPFYSACLEGHLDVVEFLMNHERIDVNTPDNNGWTPFYSACWQGRLEAVKLLVNHKRIKPNTPDNYGSTPFCSACCQDHLDVVELFVNHKRINPSTPDNYGSTPFCSACCQDHLDVVELLMNHERIDVNTPDNDGWTPFYSACWRGRLEAVKLLVNHKRIKPNTPDNYGSTPFCSACCQDHLDVVELLVNHNRIDLNTADNSGITPFNRACSAGRLKVVKLLVNNKRIKLNTPTNDGQTPLDAVYNEMQLIKDRARWDDYSAIWDVVVKKGGKFYKKKPWFSAIPDKPARPVA